MTSHDSSDCLTPLRPERRAVEKISAAVDSIDLIRVSLRNDKSEKKGAA